MVTLHRGVERRCEMGEAAKAAASSVLSTEIMVLCPAPPDQLAVCKEGERRLVLMVTNDPLISGTEH
jgi:hypothetical protein